MKIVLATSNQQKAKEITAMLPKNIDAHLQKDLGINSPPETGETFVENALIKARNASAIAQLPAIADDSGICVSALEGKPGIISARYAGSNASDQQNVDKLLEELGRTENRNAFFYCVIVFLPAADNAVPIIVEASWHGEISFTPTGRSGFGYDPIFYLPELGVTAAELSIQQKNKISHRGVALALLRRKLLEHYSA